MSQNKRCILVVGVAPDEFARVAPFLERQSFEVDRFPSADGAMELLHHVGFELVVVRFPLADSKVGEFVHDLRGNRGASRRSPVVLLTRQERQQDAETLVGHGVNRVLCLEDPESRVQQVVSELLDVAPRTAARFLARMEIKLGGAKDMILCETENLSATGMLIKTDRRYERGTRLSFELHLPDDRRPIVGIAEIVRHTLDSRERVSGVGVRFLSFAGDSQRRFETFLQGQA